jgi:putative FmdB family regulatory protein
VAEKDACVDIYRDGDVYFGEISWLRPPMPGDPAPSSATEMHEEPRVGMVILRGFRFDGREWNDGALYDPTDGKLYKGVLSLDSRGALHIKGLSGYQNPRTNHGLAKDHTLFGRLSIKAFENPPYGNKLYRKIHSGRGAIMPTYEFHCEKCGNKFTSILTMREYEKEKERFRCPKCKSKKVKQIFSPFVAKTTHKA